MPPLSLSPALLAALFVFFSGHIPTSSSDDVTVPYGNCRHTFSCGPIRNITYPFTGGDRPGHCGPPEFRLSCRDGQTQLAADSVTYNVLRIDQIRKTLTLARLDLWNNICPKQFINSTLNSSIFSYGPEDEQLTLIYGCNTSATTFRPRNLFRCNVSDTGYLTDAFYWLGPVPSDPILRIILCNVSVTVPMIRVAGERLTGNQTTLVEALMQGFNVTYTDPYDRRCLDCTKYGGQCGFDSISVESVCICDGRPCPLQRPSDNKKSKNTTAMGIGLGIAGAVVVGIGIGWLAFCLRQRRKPLSVESTQFDQVKSKDVPITTTNKTISTHTLPPTNFTKSIPSYPSTKSGFGNGSTYFGVQVFSCAELEEATDNFNSSRELGDGGFGTVYYGQLQDGRVVAVKRLYENNFKRVEQFMNEVEILTRLRHQNLVTLYGCTSKHSRGLLLVYEYIPNGTVADHLHGKRANSGLLSWPVRLGIAVETAAALEYLHRSDIIHRDVKTNNILLDNDFHVKVADFGLSRLFPNDVTHVSTAPQGTPGYVDPEYYQCYHLTEKSDVYSFGVVLVELVSSLQAVDISRHRHDINLSNMAVSKIQNHALNELVDSSLGFETDSCIRRMITLVAELAFRCLQQERDMRPSMKEVLEALQGIQNQGSSDARKAEVVDILVDEVALLKSDSPCSPDSVIPKNLIYSFTPTNSSG